QSAGGVGGGARALHGAAAAARRPAADRGAAPRPGRPSRGARAGGDVLRVPTRPGAAGGVGPRGEPAPVRREPRRKAVLSIVRVAPRTCTRLGGTSPARYGWGGHGRTGCD